MIRTLLYRSLIFTLTVGLVNLSVPMGLASTFGPIPGQRVAKPAPKPQKKQEETRYLTSHEMKRFQGRQAQNPYTAGSGKWGVQYNGMDLLTGNYTTNATDLSFDGGYGIPVNVTRSYSANTFDEGPMGIGWALSVDVRSTAGGVLKSSGAPIMSVPTNFKERPSAQLNDPNAPMQVQPPVAVVATDASGKEETIQKDVDGVLTTPPWDKNTVDAQYVDETIAGNTYQVLSQSTTTTADGTVYQYSMHGLYPNGTQPYGGGAGGEASNVLKIDSATDRQGNVTNYTYNQTGLSSGHQVYFQKYNGQTLEDCLTQVQMPNGHRINFQWGNGTNAPTNRIVSCADNNSVRVVQYTYDGSNQLHGVTLPTGSSAPYTLTTTYGYGSATPVNYLYTQVANNLLNSITDPRGMVTTIEYAIGNVKIPPYNAGMAAVAAYHVHDPSGIDHYLQVTTDGWAYDCPEICDTGIYSLGAQDRIGGATGTILRTCVMQETLDSINALFTVEMYDDLSNMGSGPQNLNGPMMWQKTYDAYTEDLLEEIHTTRPVINNDLSAARQLMLYNNLRWETDQINTWNFMGNPLSKTTNEYQDQGNGLVQTNSTTTSYAYWGQTKYYQQMAVKDPAGRFSFTDYYPNNAAQGSLGQKLYVYDPKHTSFTGTGGSGDAWKYTISPSNPNTYSGTFAYDSVGRNTDVWKLQSTTTSPWKYVQTHMNYNAASINDPAWGQATSVVEDYGGIARTTQNLAYTSWGKPCQVQDSAGHVITTNFFLDGNVQSVALGASGGQNLATYSYGSSGVTMGVPVTVADGLTGITQNLTYQTGAAGFGQVGSVTQTGGANPTYSVSYVYTSPGDRSVATYSTADGAISWQYGDYVNIGSFDQGKRVFQTLNRLGSTGSTSAEEIHYQFDTSGRLRQAAFAQMAQTGSGAPTSAPYYTSNYPAASRVISFYDYDGGGRQLDLQQGWQTWGNGAYDATQCILRNSAAYDLVRSLKTDSYFWGPTNGTPTTWSQTRHEQYGYDASFDYLTSANYGDGLTNSTPSWSYDAASNRTDSACDNLNRATSIGGTSSTCDILGNRLSLGTSTTYTWDCLNRLTGLVSSGTPSGYEYRADGMRTHKTVGSANTEYYHDGQMPIEDAVISGTTLTSTRYGLGARGIDYIEEAVGTWTSSTSRSPGAFSNVGFPLYDMHGNMIATLARSGSNTFAINNQRSYDAWGLIRQGASTSDPKNRYCGSLGHQQDDESGLIYMRARYYQPSNGRFISEDKNKNGQNWFAYAGNNPVRNIDSDGNEFLQDINSVFEEFQADFAAYRIKGGIAVNYMFRAMQFVNSLLLLANMAFQQADNFFTAAAASPSFESSQTIRSRGAELCAEGIVAILDIMQIGYQMQLATLNDFGDFSRMGSG